MHIVVGGVSITQSKCQQNLVILLYSRRCTYCINVTCVHERPKKRPFQFVFRFSLRLSFWLVFPSVPFLCVGLKSNEWPFPHLLCDRCSAESSLLYIWSMAFPRYSPLRIERNMNRKKRIRQHSPTAFCQLFNGYTQRATHSRSECFNTRALSFRYPFVLSA